MSEWGNFNLASICSSVTYGYTASAVDNDTGVKFLRITDIVPSRINWDRVPFCEISAKDLEKYKIQNGDIVVARTGATTGYNKILKNLKYTVVYASYLIKFKVNEKIANHDFVSFLLRSSNWSEYVNAIVGGSAQPGANAKQLGSFEFKLPPLPEQKAIADVLSALDDKIDLLHRQNHTLEQMAETLFRQWFVEEAQEDWEEVELKNFGTIVCGKTPSKKELDFYGNDIPFLKIPDMHGKTFILKTEDNLSYKGANSQSKKFIPANSICVSCIATVGLVCITSRELQTNQQINSIILGEDKYLYYLYSAMKSLYDELNALASGGTATLNLNTGDFSKIKIALPNDLILQKFNELAIPLFEKIKTNSQQIQTLETLRDTLLSKLISGEVRVNVQAA